MRNVRPNSSYTTVLRNAPEGVAAELTVSVLSAVDGTVVVPASGSGIVEIAPPSGNYAKSITFPDEEGLYLIQWAHGTVEMLEDESFNVTISATIADIDPGNAYASRSDLAAYLEDGLPVGFDDEYLDKVLHLASKDVDLYSSNVWYHEDVLDADATVRLKYYSALDPNVWRDDINGFVAAAVVEATCAQAEYRLAKGDQFFVEKQRAEGEFSGTQVYQPRFGPKAEEALRRVGFMVRLQTAILK